MCKFRVFISCIFIFFLSACDYNAPLRNHMIEYYSQDSNYVDLVGKVINIENEAKCEIVIISGDCEYFKLNVNGYYFSFCGSAQGVEEGDIISFTTAPMLFYNGDKYRIVYLEKDGEIVYTFEEGKRNLLIWIEETFK